MTAPSSTTDHSRVDSLLPPALLPFDTSYRPDHYGGALFTYVPAEFVATALDGVELAIAGDAVAISVFGFVVGVTIIGGHFLADMSTPMGIYRFELLGDDRFAKSGYALVSRS